MAKTKNKPKKQKVKPRKKEAKKPTRAKRIVRRRTTTAIAAPAPTVTLGPPRSLAQMLAEARDPVAARESILEVADVVTEPERMSKAEALEWLETLNTEVEVRCTALREEISHVQPGEGDRDDEHE